MAAKAANVLEENVTEWDAGTLSWGYDGDRVSPPAGLRLTGETGWHVHGDKEHQDLDVDLVFMITTSAEIPTD